MTEKLSLINVPEARKEILQSIAKYRTQQRMVEILEPFLVEVTKKTVDRRVAAALHELLAAVAPELKVLRVLYSSGKTVVGTPFFKLSIAGYDWDEERSFTVRQLSTGEWDLQSTFIADRKWKQHADYLEDRLSGFSRRAVKFNETLQELQAMASEAVPTGELFPVHPLSKYFAYYLLTRP